MGLRAAAPSLTSTSPGPGLGVGNSPNLIDSAGPGASMNAAFIRESSAGACESFYESVHSRERLYGGEVVRARIGLVVAGVGELKSRTRKSESFRARSAGLNLK